MLRTNTEKVLHEFVESVRVQAEANLGSRIKGWKSTIKENPNSITLAMEMDEYLFFQDEGVQGAGSKFGARKQTSRFKKGNTKGKMWRNLAKGSQFRFASGKPQSDGRGILKGITAWAVSKGLNPYAVARSTYMQGIPPSKFMTKALEREFKTLPSELTEAYGLDIDKFLAFAFKDNAKSLQ